ncbi:CaiB/BaiF CoA transferase family protein [Desulfatitalea tepidiphila]|uniref:CaiB/BaiF CoA transferase family protein n=1 Tax=Desulfatitalea tepidiphila TaxID=1185843 RepID=UPI0006B42B00|nr:CoA transferase [Desulfatitalea tepidiphila]
MGKQPFEGIRVLDLSNYISGSFCSKLFADYGADVIKIEKPGRGTLTRHMPPYIGDLPDINKSVYFLYLNTNKRSVTLNLKTDSGKKIFGQLIQDADILLESFCPDTASRLGLTYDVIEKLNPSLIMASVTNFGQTGPYRDFRASDLVHYAMGGAMYSTGLPEMEPLTKGPNALLFETGLQSCYAVLGAYMAARHDGVGDHIDISIMEAQLAGCERRTANLLTYQYTGDFTRRTTPIAGLFSTVPPLLPCKDGYVTVSIGPKNFSKFLTLMGRPDLANDPKWDANNMEVSSEVLKVYHDCFLKKTKMEWSEMFQKEGLICTPLSTPEDVCTDEHWKSRNFFVEVPYSSKEMVKIPRGFVRAESEWWKIRRPAPSLGQHNKEIYGELGYSIEELVALEAQGII